MNIASVSASSAPSGAHMLGYTAARNAATIPARAPATARPTSPTTTTVAVPSSADHSRCVSVLVIRSSDGMARNTM